jgi:hypothetical protein
VGTAVAVAVARGRTADDMAPSGTVGIGGGGVVAEGGLTAEGGGAETAVGGVTDTG